MLNREISKCLRGAAYATGVALALAAGSAQAGDYMMPMPPAPEPEFCFDQNLRSFDVYGGYKNVEFNDHGFNEDKDGWAAGIGVNLFFNRYVGIGGEGYFFDSGDDLSFSAAGNLILRIPIDAICLAPYGFIGGGYQFGDYDQAYWQTGLGVEWKMNNFVGLFGDARLVFTEEDADTQLYRAGLRFNF
jgi:hypothetical protein